jgi:hypothetical protein
MTPKLPGMLIRYLQQKRCVVFVGAGLSAAAGLPTWAKLLGEGVEALVGSLPDGEDHQTELLALIQRGKLLEVADFCKEKLGAAYHQFLTEQVRGDKAVLPATHKVLMNLPFSAWVTTNYDKLLERAYSEVIGGFPKTLTHRDTEALGRLLFDGGQFILKAHGDIDRPETVVLTSRDYSEIIHANPAFNEAFSGLLLTKAVLFLGYSLSDPDFRLLMDRQLTHFKGFVPERYALMSGVGPVEQDVLWRTARIRVISYQNQSGTHAEVLQFLEALKEAVSPAPASAGAPAAETTRMGIPAPAGPVAQPGQVRQHLSAGTQREARSALWANLESIFFSAPATEEPASVAPPQARPGAPAPPQAASAPIRSQTSMLEATAYLELSGDDLAAQEDEEPSPVLVPTEPHQLFIEPVEGRVQLRLHRGDSLPGVQGVAPTKLNEDVWLSLKQAMKEETASNAWLYTHLTQKLFEKYLPREVLDALGAAGPLPQEPLVLRPSPELEHFPWELIPLKGIPISLKRRLARAPVGVSAKVRGAPWIRARPRVLLIEGHGGAAGSGPREVDRLAALYPAESFSCTVLKGSDATFDRFMGELLEAQEGLPDLVHYTGDAGQMDGELYLDLPGTMDVSAGALRSVLSRGQLPFLVMNAPSSAFAPFAFGVSPAATGYQRLPVPNSRVAIFEGREGFMGLAARMGAGAFVGAFDMPSFEAGSTFMVALHRALISGLPVADAVLGARQETHQKFPDDPTALQYVLSGDGELQLWDSKRQETPG